MKKSFKTVAVKAYSWDDSKRPRLELSGKNYLSEVQTDDTVKLEISAKCVKVDKTDSKTLQALEITEIKVIERTAKKVEADNSASVSAGAETRKIKKFADLKY